MDNEKVSVLMSTYREPVEWVQGAVESILNQSYDNIELVIIVDDPGNYPVIDYLRNISSPVVHIYINPTNLGIVSSLNKGLKYCDGEYIARMDADDFSYPDRIEKQLEYLKTCSLDLVGCSCKVFDESGIIDVVHGGFTCETCKRILRLENHVPHPTWLGKSTVFRTLGGYRNINACEDYDFLFRALMTGFRIANTREILFNYRDNKGGISSSKWAEQMTNARILADAFNKGEFVTEDMCRKLFSTTYSGVYRDYQQIYALKGKYVNSDNVLEKMKCLIKLPLITEFRRKRMRRLKIKKIFKSELCQ